MAATTNDKVNFVVDDREGGCRYSLYVDAAQYNHLTIHEIQQMVADCSQHPPTTTTPPRHTCRDNPLDPQDLTRGTASSSLASSSRSSKDPQEHAVQRQTNGIAYECVTLPLPHRKSSAVAATHPCHHAQPSHARLMPGSFFLSGDDASAGAKDDAKSQTAAVHATEAPPHRHHHILNVVRRASISSQESDEAVGAGKEEAMPPTHVARWRVHRPHSPVPRSASSTSDSSAVFQIESDDGGDAAASSSSNSHSGTSVSFYEEMVTATYGHFVPTDAVSSSAASVEFQSEYGGGSGLPVYHAVAGDGSREAADEDDNWEISFETVDHSLTWHVNTEDAQSRYLSQHPSGLSHTVPVLSGAVRSPSLAGLKNTPPPAVTATYAAARRPPMTVGERFAAYKARGKQNQHNKEAKEAAAAAAAMAASGNGTAATPLGVTPTKESAPSVQSKSNTTTSSRVKKTSKKKSKTTPTPSHADVSERKANSKERVQGDLYDDENAGADLPMAATAAEPGREYVSDREVELAGLVRQLQDDVQNLLMQSQTDASRIATLRDALTNAEKEFCGLRDAHCNSLHQLQAYMALMKTNAEPTLATVPKVEEGKEEEDDDKENAEEKAAGKAAATLHVEALPAEPREEEETAAEKTPAALSESPKDAFMDAIEKAPSDDGETTMTPDVVPDASQKEADNKAQPPPPTEEQIESEEAKHEAQATSESVDETTNVAEKTADGIEKETGLRTEEKESASEEPQEQHACPLTPTAPIPLNALRHLSENELRALLKQLGYIHHNRLLRRENALLMCQLQRAQEDLRNAHKGQGVPSNARLRIVVRIRPVGLQPLSTQFSRAILTDAANADLPSNDPLQPDTAGNSNNLASLNTKTATTVGPFISPTIRTHPALNTSRTSATLQDRDVGLGGTKRLSTLPTATASVASRSARLSPQQQQQSGRLAAAASSAASVTTTVPPVLAPPSDVFLQCDLLANRLSVRNPDAGGSVVSAGGMLSSVREAAAVRGVHIVAPPLPQSLTSPSSCRTSTPLLSGAGGAAMAEKEKEPSVAHSVEERQSPDQGLDATALKAAAAHQQHTLYDETVAPLVSGMLRGESATVLSYGQAGSGKTYTIFGDCRTPKKTGVCNIAALEAEAGVVPRAIASLLDQLREKAAAEELLLRSLYASRHDIAFQAAFPFPEGRGPHQHQHHASPTSAVARTPMCELQCSMVELYVDKVRDLLAPRIDVPIYEEFAASPVLRRPAGHDVNFRSSSAERRRLRQVHEAQAAATAASAPRSSANIDNNGSADAAEAMAKRKIIGHTSVSPECTLKAAADGSTHVVGATKVSFRTLEEAAAVLQRGLANRETHATSANPKSSRSHVVLTLTLKQQVWGTEPTVPHSAPRAATAAAEGDETAEGNGAATETSAAAADKPVKKKKAKTVAMKRNERVSASAVPKRGRVGGAAQKKLKKKAKASAHAGHMTEDATAAETAITAPSLANLSSPHKGKRRVGAVEGMDDDVDTATVSVTATDVEAQEHKAQEQYLRRRIVKSLTSSLVFVDLAGTARTTSVNTATEVERLRETQAIGKGLAALGDVLSGLYGGNGVSAPACGAGGPISHAHVPFRSHKLTVLLHDALLEPSRLVILACVALSESPMRLLLSASGERDTSPPAETSSNSSTGNVEREYWHQAVSRYVASLAAPQRRTSEPKGVLDVTATSKPSRSSVLSSRQPSTRLSARRGSLQRGLVTESGSARDAKKKAAKSTSRVTVAPARVSATLHSGRFPSTSPPQQPHEQWRDSSPMPTHNDLAEEKKKQTEKSGSRACVSPEAQPASLPAASSAASVLSPSPQRQSQRDERVEPAAGAAAEDVERFNMQMDAMENNAEAEERAATGALWITPRETLSTLVFLSRLWKA